MCCRNHKDTKTALRLTPVNAFSPTTLLRLSYKLYVDSFVGNRY